MRQFTNVSQGTLATDLNSGVGFDDGVLPSSGTKKTERTVTKQTFPFSTANVLSTLQTPDISKKRTQTFIPKKVIDTSRITPGTQTSSQGASPSVGVDLGIDPSVFAPSFGVRQTATPAQASRPTLNTVGPTETLEEVLPVVEIFEEPIDNTIPTYAQEEPEIRVLRQTTEPVEAASGTNYTPWIAAGAAGLLLIGLAVYAVRSK